jgi:hypothetical protein
MRLRSGHCDPDFFYALDRRSRVVKLPLELRTVRFPQCRSVHDQRRDALVQPAGLDPSGFRMSIQYPQGVGLNGHRRAT